MSEDIMKHATRFDEIKVQNATLSTQAALSTFDLGPLEYMSVLTSLITGYVAHCSPNIEHARFGLQMSYDDACELLENAFEKRGIN
jgi:hypothetical protein